MSQQEPVDIAIVTILPEEYRAIHELLRDPQLDPGAPDAPNLYAWELGWIDHGGGAGAYRVALALAGRAGNVTASQATVATVERWEPRYLLLVGISGGFSHDGCTLGDVVVSSAIYGYEYGKLEGSFEPRPHWVYRPDTALLTSATGFAAVNPDWSEGLRSGEMPPKVLLGAVASGEKVVDDPTNAFFDAVRKAFPKLQAIEMEGAGAASAIEYLHARGRTIGFLMVRGVSDMPRQTTPEGASAEGGRSQSAERDRNKKLACAAAARFTARWIATTWPVPARAATTKGARPLKPEKDPR